MNNYLAATMCNETTAMIISGIAIAIAVVMVIVILIDIG